MKMKRYVLMGFVAGISALAFASCAYDPYYSSSSYGGYGDGYGYGGSGFSTSYFVSTGSSRWQYDPYAGAYYDNNRRCYYDPYLNGYYPVGYRPRYVYGAPHPHGWSRGSNYCPPPSSVRSYTLTNYRDRSERYRSLGRSWSNDVRVDTRGSSQQSGYGGRDPRGSSGRDPRSSGGSPGSIFGGGGQRPDSDGRSSGSRGSFGDRSGGGDNRGYTPQRGGSGQPDPRSRESSQWNGSSGRGGSAPVVIPQISRDRSPQDGGSRYSGRPEAPRSAPQFESRGERSGGERSRGNPERGNSERGNSDRGSDGKIKGLGEG